MDTREQQADKSKGAPWVCHNGHIGCGMPSGHSPEGCRDERQRYHVYQCDPSGEVWLVYAEEIRPVPCIHTEGRIWQYIETVALMPWQSYEDVRVVTPRMRQYSIYQHAITGAVSLDDEGDEWRFVQATPLMPTRPRAMAWAIDYVRGPRAQDG